MGRQHSSATSARAEASPPALRPLRVIHGGGLAERAPSVLDKRGAFARSVGTDRELPIASLLFAPGDRSSVDQVRELAAAEPSFAISFDPEEGALSDASEEADRWVEVLAKGLPFDMQGLAPSSSQPLPSGTHRYGLPRDFNVGALEAISLRPGPSLGTSGRMMPVVRGLAWLTAMLAGLPGVRAVGWNAARTLSSPDHFRSSVVKWVVGGAFPGLGLTALAPMSDGGLQSEGLSLFIGQELRLSPELADDQAAGARLALRLLHWLVDHGRLDAPLHLPGPSGEPLVLRPSERMRFVDVARG